jgi:[acyl-carrier-protein] S-malonyltransferase
MSQNVPPWIALFPGQGSQAVGMGATLAETHPAAREVFERADAALGEPLSRLCFEGPEDQLRLTRNTQPALLTVSTAAWRLLEAEDVAAPVAAAGHSLGEYSALVAAGVLEFEDALRAVRLRGEAMQEAVPVGEGAMAALIGLDAEAAERLCAEVREGDEVLVPANYNAPDQTVVAGHRAAVERLVARARDAGARRALPLPVSAPFHCPLMEPAAARLAAFLADLEFRPARFPVVTNVDARPTMGGSEAREALVRQVASPVRWVETVRWLAGETEAGVALEIGAGKVLAGLVKRAAPSLATRPMGEAQDVAAARAAVAGEER